MVEGARLESVYTGNRIAGSNPALSATKSLKLLVFQNLQGIACKLAVFRGVCREVRTERQISREMGSKLLEFSVHHMGSSVPSKYAGLIGEHPARPEKRVKAARLFVERRNYGKL